VGGLKFRLTGAQEINDQYGVTQTTLRSIFRRAA
jgi:hypothetical protein